MIYYMKHTKYLILGAGVSGLSFANNIDSNDYLILEKEHEAGGYCRTTRRNGFVWDYVPKGWWRQMENFSTNSLAFVVASTPYSREDYIYDYEEFKKMDL